MRLSTSGRGRMFKSVVCEDAIHDSSSRHSLLFKRHPISRHLKIIPVSDLFLSFCQTENKDEPFFWDFLSISFLTTNCHSWSTSHEDHDLRVRVAWWPLDWCRYQRHDTRIDEIRLWSYYGRFASTLSGIEVSKSRSFHSLTTVAGFCLPFLQVHKNW